MELDCKPALEIKEICDEGDVLIDLQKNQSSDCNNYCHANRLDSF